VECARTSGPLLDAIDAGISGIVIDGDDGPIGALFVAVPYTGSDADVQAMSEEVKADGEGYGAFGSEASLTRHTYHRWALHRDGEVSFVVTTRAFSAADALRVLKQLNKGAVRRISGD